MSHLQQADQFDQLIADGRSGDEKLHVTFYTHPVHDPEASAKEGRPIYRDAEYVRIIIPGNKDLTIEREVRDYPEYSDKVRFPKQYEAWKRGQSQEGAVGTPLSAWPVVTRAQVEELSYFGVKTVEQLAGMSDTHAQKFMGLNGLRQRAKDFLQAAKEAAPLAAVRSELEKRDEELNALRDASAAQARIIEELRASIKAK